MLDDLAYFYTSKALIAASNGFVNRADFEFGIKSRPDYEFHHTAETRNDIKKGYDSILWYRISKK